MYCQVNNSRKLWEMTEHQETLREPLHCVLVKVNRKKKYSYTSCFLLIDVYLSSFMLRGCSHGDGISFILHSCDKSPRVFFCMQCWAVLSKRRMRQVSNNQCSAPCNNSVLRPCTSASRVCSVSVVSKISFFILSCFHFNCNQNLIWYATNSSS